MTLDDVLERGLAAAADDYDVPAGAVDRLREQLAPAEAAAENQNDRPSKRAWRLSGHSWMGIAAALVIALIIVPFAIGGSNDQGESAGVANPANRINGAGVGGGADVGAPSDGEFASGTAGLVQNQKTQRLPAGAAAPAQAPAAAS